MDEFTTYQWLVLVPLWVIMICVLGITFGLDKILERMTQRIEFAVAGLKRRGESL